MTLLRPHYCRARFLWYRRVFLTVAVSTVAALPIAAQQTFPAGFATAYSAKGNALQKYGTVRDSSGAEMVARCLYVKIRAGASVDAVSAAGEIAFHCGLGPTFSSVIGFSELGNKKVLAARTRDLPAASQSRVLAGFADLYQIVEVRYTNDIPPRVAAALVSRRAEVEYAEPVYVPQVLSSPSAPPNDPLFDLQTELKIIKAPEAWSIWPGDTNTVIGVVDAGIDNTHIDLAPNIRENPGETGLDAQGQDKRTNGIDDDGDGVVDDWKGANLTAEEDGTKPGDTRGISHGTEVSGLAAAATNNGIGIAGVANKCRFFPIKTAPANSGNITRGYDGILYAAQHGCKVINLSWGEANYSQAFQDIISDVVAIYDVAIVAAGGNSAIYGPRYPAGYRHVLGVGATDSADRFASTWGEQIGISSPTGYTTTDGNAYGIATNATSFTAPVVSGALALLRSKYPALSADQAMAHLRLMADNIDAIQPDKAKLVGYGRLNMERSLKTDPFSHPAITVDSTWLVDATGQVRNGFRVGELGTLKFRLVNYLGDARNVSLGFETYTSDSNVVSFDKKHISFATLKGSTTKQIVETGIPFQVIGQSDRRVKVRFTFTADSGYSDYHYEQLPVYRPYTDIKTSRLTLSLTDKGKIGFADYPQNSVGNGVRYLDNSFEYEGGFIVASDSLHIVSNVRDASADAQASDFTTIELPSAANDSTLFLTDGSADSLRRIGLELRLNSVAINSIPDAVGIRMRVKNISGARFDTLRVAMFVDWDHTGYEHAQKVSFVGQPVSNVPFYASITDSSGYTVAHGVAAPAPFPIFYALQNDGSVINLYNGFPLYLKWLTVSNGVGSPSAGPGDISVVVGKRIPGLGAGAEDTTLFLVGIAPASPGAVKAIEDLAPRAPSSTVSLVSDDDSQLAFGNADPDPFSDVTRLRLTAGRANSSLVIYDALGRQRADLTPLLPLTTGPATVLLDATAWSSGVYYARLSSGKRILTRQLVLIR